MCVRLFVKVTQNVQNDLGGTRSRGLVRYEKDPGRIARRRPGVKCQRLGRVLSLVYSLSKLFQQAITGMGRASKEQVAYFLQKVYHLT